MQLMILSSVVAQAKPLLVMRSNQIREGDVVRRLSPVNLHLCHADKVNFMLSNDELIEFLVFPSSSLRVETVDILKEEGESVRRLWRQNIS